MKQFLLLLLLPVLVSAQSLLEKSSMSGNIYSVELSSNFYSYSLEKNGFGNEIKFDGFVDESKPGQFTLPRREIFLAIPPDSDPQVEVQILSASELNGLPGINPEVQLNEENEVIYSKVKLSKYEPQPLFIKRGYLWIGGNYCLHLSLEIFEPDLINRKTVKNDRFQINLKFKHQLSDRPVAQSAEAQVSDLVLNRKFASLFLSRPDLAVAKTDDWLNYNDTFVKIGVGEDGIQRLYGEDLLQLGITLSGIETARLKIFNRGIEIPIFVSDAGDGFLGAEDYLEFPARRNYTDKHRELNEFGTPYNEYLNKYTDTTIYWLTWTPGQGQRIVSRIPPAIFPPDTIDFYDYVEHFEKNPWFDYAIQDIVRRQDPEWLENETWNWWVQNVGTSARRFSITNIYPNRLSRAFVKMQGYVGDIYTNTYDLGMSINNDTTIYSRGKMGRYEQKLLTAQFTSSLWNEGGNKIVVHSYKTGASINLTWGDWFEIEVPRYLQIKGGRLNFEYHSLGKDSNAVVKISGISSSNYSLYKGIGSGAIKIDDFKLSSGILSFTETVQNGDRFFLASDSAVSKPKIYYAKKFKNLRDSRNHADYLIITHPKLQNAAKDYSKFIEQNYGVVSKVIDVFDIFDEFRYGYPEPESIKEFLKSTHIFWQAPSPKSVFIIGEANYDYKGYVVERGVPPVENLVPAFGVSSSDPWFTVWDTTGAYIQSMNIGRIPAENEDQVYYYLNKHKAYLERPFDAINKNYLLFSGGKGDNQSEINLLKSSNDFVESLLQIRPTGGRPIHLYKTYEPKTDFGPYSEQFISDAISGGSLFISYLGHSGVQIWDNSIVSPSQLRNNAGISPLITDFGCSTGKFAEPELNSFAELFVLDPSGQAINYAGNASLGFISSATAFPAFFYPALMSDSSHNIGEAHKRGKYALMENYGAYGVYKMFALCNVLIGDPIVNLKVPRKPNLKAELSGVSIKTDNFTDQTDSIKIALRYHNFGLAPADTFSINVSHYYLNEKISEIQLRKVVPIYEDSTEFSILSKLKAGKHKIIITLDSKNVIEEIYENDNSVELDIVVPSLSFKSMTSTSTANSALSGLTILNSNFSSGSSSLIAELDTLENFQNPVSWEVPLDTFTTEVNFQNLIPDRRYFFRVKDNTPESDYSSVISFLNRGTEDYLLSDEASLSSLLQTTDLKMTGDSLQLENREFVFEVFSAGFNDGRTALARVNGANYIDQSDNTGHHVVVFNRETLEFESYKLFNTLFGGAGAVADYIAHLDSLDDTKLVVIAISDEGSGNLSGDIRNKIKEFGSVLIDSVGWRSSWAMIGYRGAAPGSIVEDWHPAFGGIVEIDTTIVKKRTTGKFETELIGPASGWENVKISGSAANGSSIKFHILGYDKEQNLIAQDSSLTLNSPVSFPANFSLAENVKIAGMLNAGAGSESPVLSEIGINFSGLSELGTNYQVVSLSADSVEQGIPVEFNFYVYNVGEVSADSFSVSVDKVVSGGQKTQIFAESGVTISAGERRGFHVSYDTSPENGLMNFVVNIDPENLIREYFEDNNYYSQELYVSRDTAVPAISVSIDGRDIFDGEYISGNPEIQIELNDASPLPIVSSDRIGILVNGNPPDSGTVKYSFANVNPRASAVFSPKLDDGDYSLKVFGFDASDNPSDTLKRFFRITNETEVLDLFNYPNPFAEETYFTFKLTQIPDDITIKIYTIAGRMIKEIKLNSGELKHDFNKIFWNGRDEDGDLVANGVYIYKLILKDGDKTKSLSQKLAIVK